VALLFGFGKVVSLTSAWTSRIIAAIISSFRDRPISKESVFIGEVSLTGEIKDVYSIDLRLKEAQAQGIKKAIIAQKTNLKLDLKTFAVDEVSKVIELF
jgi:DNA repair protein RadA/Sms